MTQITLTAADINELREWLYDHEFDTEEISFRTEYSGRGMYGRTCFGVVGNSEQTSAAVIGLYELLKDREGAGAAIEIATSHSSDSMGYDKILYWRQITVED